MISLTHSSTNCGSMHSRTCAAPHRICTAVRHRTAQRVSYNLGDQSKAPNNEFGLPVYNVKAELEKLLPKHHAEQEKAIQQQSEALKTFSVSCLTDELVK